MADPQEAVIVTYLSAMAQGDLDSVCACFTADATIKSPVYGEVSIRRFYEQLFDDTLRTEVELQHIYCTQPPSNRWAAHFSYKWWRKSGTSLETDLVDLFEFDGNLIKKLKIIFNGRPG